MLSVTSLSAMDTPKGFKTVIAGGLRCSTAAACPCCGACLAAGFVPVGNKGKDPECPVCNARQRHRWLCFNFGTDLPHALRGASDPLV
eukprot:CAMPEP_0119093102 /NCGR_PEP_ID=MMETSP1178-20130426/162042_1 /TAXON_ID=33656 /ORGANISM="unid sp, Strain CCMP2000" /LENGTH=87 /DNA_ID=CAMNT_0007076739 /DNA_START=78 /DNA_END=338 /DNA_ORIENTATION=+